MLRRLEDSAFYKSLLYAVTMLGANIGLTHRIFKTRLIVSSFNYLSCIDTYFESYICNESENVRARLIFETLILIAAMRDFVETNKSLIFYLN